MIIKSMQKGLLLSSSLLTASSAMEQNTQQQIVPHCSTETQSIAEHELNIQNNQVQFNQNCLGDFLSESDQVLFGNVAYGMVEGVITEVTTIVETIISNAIRINGPKALGFVGKQLGSLVAHQAGEMAINIAVGHIVDLLTANLDVPQRIFRIANELIIITKIISEHVVQNMNNNANSNILTQICTRYARAQLQTTLTSFFSSDVGTFKGHINAVAQQTKVATDFKGHCQAIGGFTAYHSIFGVGTYLIERNVIPVINSAFKEMRAQILNHDSLSTLMSHAQTYQLKFNELVLEQESEKLHEIAQMRQEFDGKIAASKNMTTQQIEKSRQLVTEPAALSINNQQIVSTGTEQEDFGWRSRIWQLGRTVVTSSTQTVSSVVNTSVQAVGSITYATAQTAYETNLQTRHMVYAAAEIAKVETYALSWNAWMFYKRNANLEAHRQTASLASRLATRELVVKLLTHFKTKNEAREFIAPVTMDFYFLGSYVLGGLLVEMPLALYNNSYHLRDMSMIAFASYARPEIAAGLFACNMG